MNRRWVANASPLILLGKVSQLGLLTELTDELILPKTVVREVTGKPDGERAIEELTSASGVELAPDRSVPHLIEVWDLGPGESQVLLLAQDEPGSRAVLDDLELRRRTIGVRRNRAIAEHVFVQ